MFYCFRCGEQYNKSDSLASNTPELHAETYCSLICHDKDTEQMEADIKAAAIADSKASPESATIPVIEEIKVGGFNMKVRIK